MSRTAADPAVTEVAAGSGLYGPTLVRRVPELRARRPAALFALSVVRRPAPRHRDRARWRLDRVRPGRAATGCPSPSARRACGSSRDEGAGEVQTPLLGHGRRRRCAVGDRVWFRHAKAGELCEHVNELHLVDGDSGASRPTYRGEGKAFL